MKRIFAFITAAILTLPLVWSCTEETQEVPVTSVTLSQPTAEMIIGETISLKVTISPSNATDKVITWASSKLSVATVDQEGKVEAISEGTSTITASAGGKIGSCTVNVIKGFVAVSSIELNKTVLPLEEDEEFLLEATVKPDDATDKTVSWESSNRSVATIDQNGRVKGIKEGEAKITAKAGDITAECAVAVSAKKIPVTMVMLNKESLSMIVGDEYHLVATVVPDNATDKAVQWSSNNTEVATVDPETGLVKAIKEGDAKVVAYADGQTATCVVHVDYIPVQSISLDKFSITLYEGEDYTLVGTITPENATYKDITWTTGDNEIATVENGKVLAVKKGNTTITATANGKSATCSVEVLSSIAEISLSKTALSMIVGDSEILQAIITPEDATLREDIKWESSNDDVVTVDSSGKVIAVKEGEATITVSVEGKKAECKVSIDYIHVSSITMDKTDETLYIGENLSITATLNPSNVTYNTVTWVSSDENVAMVDQNGRVSAIGKGVATIFAKSDGKESKCAITVLVPLSGLSFDQTSLSIFKGGTASLTLIKTPSDATLKGEPTWSSTNMNVATVSGDGVITAINSGSATITATVDGYTATCSVNVLEAVTGIYLNKTYATVNRGNTLHLYCNVQPAGATIQGQVSWESSDTSVATVNDGYVTAVAAGSARITVYLEGFSASCDITVVVPVTSVSLNKNTLELIKGESETLTATINPSDATDKIVSWTSSNTNVATVSSGRIQAVGAGSAIIKAMAGDCMASCQVNVVVPVESVSLSETSLVLEKGSSADLTATISPFDATITDFAWQTTDESVVSYTVKNNSKTITVKANAGGTASIIVVADNKSAECVIQVTVSVQSVSLNKSSVSLRQNETFQLTATVLPADADARTVTWTSSDPTIATVDASGLIKAEKEGRATITATAGGKSSSCYVTVSNEISGGSHEGTETEIWE